jgi:aromatic-L-amino-acid/L-tryptophan decarboxylase
MDINMDILSKLEILESQARQLEVLDERRNEWLTAVNNYGHRFLDALPTQKAYQDYDLPTVAGYTFDIQDEPTPVDTVIEEVEKWIDQPGLNPASGGHLGYIPGGGVFPTALGDFMAAINNNYAGIFYGGPGAVRLENSMVRWVCDLIGYPKTAMGNLASGGSIATLIAIVTARDYKEIDSTNIRQSVIYLTEQAHHCVQKAIRIGGLGEAQLRYIPLMEDYRMDVAALREIVEADKANGLNPFLVLANAGATDTGIVDPLDEIADVAEEHNLWYHIDGAYGGFFILVDELKPLFKGIERSDSFVTDPHKGLFLSYGLGMVVIKNTEAMYNSHQYKPSEANYMQDAVDFVEEFSPADLSPELTKHFRGLRMYMPLKLYGLNTFKNALEEKVYLTRYFYEKITELGFETGGYPMLSVMMYRYVPKNATLEAANEWNKQLVEIVKADGRVFISSTKLEGVFWLRLAVLSFRTHLYHIEVLLELLKKGISN